MLWLLAAYSPSRPSLPGSNMDRPAGSQEDRWGKEETKEETRKMGNEGSEVTRLLHTDDPPSRHRALLSTRLYTGWHWDCSCHLFIVPKYEPYIIICASSVFAAQTLSISPYPSYSFPLLMANTVLLAVFYSTSASATISIVAS